MKNTIQVSSVLLNDAGDDKYNVAQIVAEIVNISLMSAKDLLVETPSIIKENISYEEADGIKSKLELTGAVVEIVTYNIEKKILTLLKILTIAMAYESEIEPDEIYQFIPNKVATNEIINQIEENLGVNIPTDLKNIYLEEGNGIQYDEDSWSSDEHFQVYPLENIRNLYDFFETQCSYFDLSMHLNYSDEIMVEIENFSKSLFVYAVSNGEGNQFIDVFLFDREGRFYTIEYDHDEIFYYYESYLKDFYKNNKSYILFEFLYGYIKNMAKKCLDYQDISIESIIADVV